MASLEAAFAKAAEDAEDARSAPSLYVDGPMDARGEAWLA